ncbi:hypothetical protein [Kiloniella laminariae]|uniref:hypothetical protein n=1 Tax=Kiloniella laminariae TaxID=454162 RepID=UPI00035E1C8E|nr:hypothetical protein [Kiloniella laminariae]
MAAEFQLVKGNQFELCQDYKQNLDYYPELEETPMYIPFHLDFSDFREVEWVDLVPGEYLEEIKIHVQDQWDLRGRLTEEERFVQWEKRKDKILQKLAEGTLRLGKASFDANHDGNRETVYRFGQHIWPSLYKEDGFTFAWSLFVRPADDERASQQLRAYSRTPLIPFYYKGRVFYLGGGGGYEFEILEPNELSTLNKVHLRNVCMFKIIK